MSELKQMSQVSTESLAFIFGELDDIIKAGNTLTQEDSVVWVASWKELKKRGVVL